MRLFSVLLLPQKTALFGFLAAVILSVVSFMPISEFRAAVIVGIVLLAVLITVSVITWELYKRRYLGIDLCITVYALPLQGNVLPKEGYSIGIDNSVLWSDGNLYGIDSVQSTNSIYPLFFTGPFAKARLIYVAMSMGYTPCGDNKN